MRKILGQLAFVAFVALSVSPVVAQTPPDASARQPAKKDAPPTTVEVDRSKVETGTSKRRASRVKHRRHAHGVRRHRTARHHRNRWRDVWVYSYDRHGYRHYEYVRRKFGGYFARGRADCACRRGSHRHYRAHHAHL
jgi:hypothetical protein